MLTTTFLYKNDKLYRIVSENFLEFQAIEFKRVHYAKFKSGVLGSVMTVDDFICYTKFEEDRGAKVQIVPG